MMSQKPRSCGTTFRSWSEVVSRLDLHARMHPHVKVGVVVIVDLPQGPRRCAPDGTHFVPKGSVETLAGAGALDLAQRPRRGGADILVAVLQGPNERFDGIPVLDLAQSPRRQDAHVGLLVLQR